MDPTKLQFQGFWANESDVKKFSIENLDYQLHADKFSRKLEIIIFWGTLVVDIVIIWTPYSFEKFQNAIF